METVIKQAITDMLVAQELPVVAFTVEHPADLIHGDYASNIAMVLAKQVGQSPRELAAQFAQELTDTIEYVTEVSVAGPGFLNFRLHRDFFSREVMRIVERAEDWGKNATGQGKKVLIEKSAPNLYKPFHVGHLLNITIAESISRLTKMSGAEVIDVSYPSDISLGVAKTVWALIKYGGDAGDIRSLGEAYVTGTNAYEQSPEVQEEVKAININLNTRQSGQVWELYLRGRETSLGYFHYITTRLGSTFTDHFYESEAGIRGREIVEEKLGIVFEKSEGAIIFAGEKYDLHTRVFVTSEGLPVYEAKDIGLIALKFEKYNPDESILYTDVEQKQYFEVLKKVAELTFGEWGKKTHYLQHGRLRFADGKVSSRLGNVPLAEDLLETVKSAAEEKISASQKLYQDTDVDALTEAVAIGAIKYTFLKVSPGQNIVFEISQALSFEGDAGPYLQYTHARIVSVLEKARNAGITVSVGMTPDEPYAVERLVYQFPEVIEAALAERAPHQVATYLTQLAGAFNTFYAHEMIADPTDQYAPYKAAVADAVRITLKNGLWVLGIKAPERL